jgi:hypothetical protein
MDKRTLGANGPADFPRFGGHGVIRRRGPLLS